MWCTGEPDESECLDECDGCAMECVDDDYYEECVEDCLSGRGGIRILENRIYPVFRAR